MQFEAKYRCRSSNACIGCRFLSAHDRYGARCSDAGCSEHVVGHTEVLREDTRIGFRIRHKYQEGQGDRHHFGCADGQNSEW